ncbi:MAG: hypothetical protein AAF224_09225 [Pseudomonadota bacterium]
MPKQLFVANAGANAGRALAGSVVNERLMFDKPGALSRRRGGFAAAGRSVFGSLNFFKNMGQGACAGLLTLLGATHLTGVMPGNSEAAAPLIGTVDTTTMEGLAASLLVGGLPGILEIIGAIALFLNAGRGAGRILGLLIFVGIAVSHANGVSHTEFLQNLTQASNFVQTFAAQFGGWLPAFAM